VLPTGTVEILFLHGDPIEHVEADHRIAMPRNYVTGQRSKPVFPVSAGRLRAVIVSLYPWGLKTLFAAGVEAVDGYVDLAILDRSARLPRLEKELMRARGTQQRVKLVERYLLETRGECLDARMVSASRMLADDFAGRPLELAAHTLAVSERHFSRQFKATIGIQPSVFARIMRFQRAIRLRRRCALPWAAIAADCGFSDQAHLVREVQAFAGRPPTRLNLDTSPPEGTFNGDGVSGFFDTVYA
jgi:AraC-like DNA-binding protein